MRSLLPALLAASLAAAPCLAEDVRKNPPPAPKKPVVPKRDDKWDPTAPNDNLGRFSKVGRDRLLEQQKQEAAKK